MPQKRKKIPSGSKLPIDLSQGELRLIRERTLLTLTSGVWLWRNAVSSSWNFPLTTLKRFRGTLRREPIIRRTKKFKASWTQSTRSCKDSSTTMTTRENNAPDGLDLIARDSVTGQSALTPRHSVRLAIFGATFGATLIAKNRAKERKREERQIIVNSLIFLPFPLNCW